MLYASPNTPDAKVAFKKQYDNFINGRFVAPVKGQYFDVITPISGRAYTRAARSTAEDIELALDDAHSAAAKWAATNPAERANLLLKIADRNEQNLELLAYAETEDNGKPIRETLNADIPLAADHLRCFAGCVRAQEGALSQIDDNTVAYHFHEPLGVVGQIIPWNFRPSTQTRASSLPGDDEMVQRPVGFIFKLAATALIAGTLGAAAHADNGMAQAADPSAWPMHGRGYDNTRYSPLKQINTGNVGQLKLAYSFQLGSLRSNEASPIVIGDTMYVSTSWGPKYVYALDARTGARKWTYEPEIPDDTLQYACCDVNSRGVTYANGKIFVGRLDGKLSAVDAATGKELWTTTVVDYKQGSVITSPPLVVKNIVITGFGGGEYGARGSLQAYDVNTGKEVWKTWTVPGPGEANNDTWKGDSWQHGGAVLWLTGSYDPKTNTVLWGTSNPAPWNSAVRSTGDGNYGKLSNLYSSSTVAFDADTGKIKWWVQATPQDAWDYDGVNELVLADLTISGKKTPVYMKADRNGFFYVVNRESGKIVSAEKYVPTNWATKIDVATGKPVEDPAKRPGPNHPVKGVCPNLIGGKNWQPMSFNPQTGLVYIPSNNVCMDWAVSEVNYKKGVFYLGADFPTMPGPGGYMGELMAWDPVAQKKVWGVKTDLPFNGGTLTTAGGLTFWGDLHGVFHAYDAKNGKELWKARLGSGIGAGPISYSVDGKQYVAVVVGRTAAIPAFLGEVGKKMTEATPEGGALFVFSE